MSDLLLPDSPFAPVAAVLAGLALLLFGRRLFWLAVGLAGFAVGLVLARRFLALDPWWLELGAALLAGALAALATIFLQRLVVSLGGFVAGALLVLQVGKLSGTPPEGFFWVLFAVLGGVAGAILAALLFEAALAAVTSLVGAHLLLTAAKVPPSLSFVLLLVLAAAGTVLQLAFGRKRRGEG
jgi:hypothetical protein